MIDWQLDSTTDRGYKLQEKRLNIRSSTEMYLRSKKFVFLATGFKLLTSVCMIRSDEVLTLKTSFIENSLRWPVYIINPVDKNLLISFNLSLSGIKKMHLYLN